MFYQCISILLYLAMLPPSLGRVCSQGEIAIGKASIQINDSSGKALSTASMGFMMDNNCDIFATNMGLGVGMSVQAFIQGGGGDRICGSYGGKASVQCDSSGNPTAATDTDGNKWSCHSTTDSGCNGNNHTIVACCDITAHASKKRWSWPAF